MWEGMGIWITVLVTFYDVFTWTKVWEGWGLYDISYYFFTIYLADILRYITFSMTFLITFYDVFTWTEVWEGWGFVFPFLLHFLIFFMTFLTELKFGQIWGFVLPPFVLRIFHINNLFCKPNMIEDLFQLIFHLFELK